MGYLVCSRKKSRPMVSSDLCGRCSRRMRCEDYRSYVEPPLFEGQTAADAGGKRRTRFHKALCGAESPCGSPGVTEQLAFDFGS
jgi:hypothetical protein